MKTQNFTHSFLNKRVLKTLSLANVPSQQKIFHLYTALISGHFSSLKVTASYNLSLVVLPLYKENAVLITLNLGLLNETSHEEEHMIRAAKSIINRTVLIFSHRYH